MKSYKSFGHCAFAMLLFAALMTFGACNDPETGLISYNGNYTGDEAVSFTLPDGSVEIRSGADAADAEPASAGIACENIYVSVLGEVVSPGVYVMPEGSRVYELINEAGGATADADTSRLNLVAKLEDGMQIVVPAVSDAVAGEDEAYGVSGTATGVYDSRVYDSGVYGSGDLSGGGLVNINTAGLNELMTLTGIGKTRAEAIIRYRESSGGFNTCEDLMCVNGIKQGIYDGLKDQICVR